jgi:hypothetical protein
MTTLVQLLSGIKKESSVWDFFSYNATTSKSRCTVLNDKGDECGFQMAGKRTSNLKLHIKAKHPSVFSVIEKDDEQKSCKKKAEDMVNQGRYNGGCLIFLGLNKCKV